MSQCPRFASLCTWGVVALAAAAATLTGCQSTHVKQPKVLPERTEVTRIFTPKWYEAEPINEAGQLVTTAQAVGVNPTISESLAINQARQAMALTIDSRVDVLQRNFQEQIEAAGDLNLLQRFQDVNAIVVSQSLHGSVVKRKETYLEPNGDYRTFVLMELDNRTVDASYLDQLRRRDELETRLRSGEAWAELERRAKELRDENGQRGLPPMSDREIRDGSNL